MVTFDTPAPIDAVVNVPLGLVTVRASDTEQTVVDVRPIDEGRSADEQAAADAEVEYAGGHLEVKVARRRLGSIIGRPPSVEVTVELPAGSRLDATAWGEVRSEGRLGDATVNTAAGAVRLDRTGRLKLRTAAGDVSVARAGGHADVTTASGKIRIGAVDGTAAVKTSNGDITLGRVARDVRLRTANGDITVDHALGTVTAKTAHGSVRIGEVARGGVVVDTGFGEIEVGVRAGTAAWVDARSGQGQVRSQLDATGAPGPGDDTVEVRARTGFGDILIRRAVPTDADVPVDVDADGDLHPADATGAAQGPEDRS